MKKETTPKTDETQEETTEKTTEETTETDETQEETTEKTTEETTETVVTQEPNFTVKPMPGREDMYVIYEGSKQTDFVNTLQRCNTQAAHLNDSM